MVHGQRGSELLTFFTTMAHPELDGGGIPANNRRAQLESQMLDSSDLTSHILTLESCMDSYFFTKKAEAIIIIIGVVVVVVSIPALDPYSLPAGGLQISDLSLHQQQL